MQDVERVKAAILEVVANAPFLDFYEYDKDDNEVPITFRTFIEDTWVGDRANRILEDAAQLAATAAISAMTPCTALSHALHAGEDVGFARGWNAAIEAAAGVAEDHTRNYSPGTFKGLRENMAQAIRQLKKDNQP